jgi:DNA-binding NtrC family response regulator
LSNSVLFLTFDGDISAYLRDRLQSANISLVVANSIHHAEEELLTRKHKAIINRTEVVCSANFELLRFVRQHNLTTTVIVNSRTGSVEDAVRLMKAGAGDFVLTSSPDARLVESVIRCISVEKAPEVASADSNHVGEKDTLLIGQSAAIAELRSAVALIAKSQTSVLITGESGTGKEVVARYIHRESLRADKPFIALNCAALPKDVMENELFGHERGAFTGALLKKSGCFEMADQGTLFFDEIAEMTFDIQAKLLRAIELGTFRRLGGKDETHVNVRLIAATNKDVSKALRAMELREDLYYRLSTIEIFIPPLREHKEDIVPLCQHFLAMFASKYGKEPQRFSDETIETLIAYDWPGNIRELRNVVERCVVICQNSVIDPQCLPSRISGGVPIGNQISIPLGSSTEQAERLLILQTLASVQNNKSKAARILGLSRKTLHNKLDYFAQQEQAGHQGYAQA